MRCRPPSGAGPARPCASPLPVAYDAPYPGPAIAARPMTAALAGGVVLGSGDGPTIEAQTAEEPFTTMSDGGLERVRRGSPAARVLPLLACIARGAPGRVVLD